MTDKETTEEPLNEPKPDRRITRIRIAEMEHDSSTETSTETSTESNAESNSEK